MTRETGWIQAPLKRLTVPVFKRLWDVEVTGLENVPESGPALITPNHVSFIDSVFIIMLMPRRTLAVGDFVESWIAYDRLGHVGLTVSRRDGLIAPNRLVARADDFRLLGRVD